MTSSNNELAEDLAKSLASSTKLMQSLLGEIRENAGTLAGLKEKFDFLAEKVQSLAHLLNDNNGQRSVLTRLALLESSLTDLIKDVDELYTTNTEHLKQDEITHTDINNKTLALKDTIQELREALFIGINSMKGVMDTKKSDKEYKREKTKELLKIIGLALPGIISLIIKLIETITASTP